MVREQAIHLLKQNEAELRAAGVGGLFLFGSVAADRAREGSDVDIFFDLSRTQGFTLVNLVRLKERLESILGVHVDLMTRAAIHPRRRSRIEASAVRVF
jgi:predicted nucleotidyltransferase